MNKMVLMTGNANVKTAEQKLRRITLEIRHEDREDLAVVGIGNDKRIVTFGRILNDKEEAKWIFEIFVESFGQPLLEATFNSPENGYGKREWEWWI
jgi:hypothetical protein